AEGVAVALFARVLPSSARLRLTAFETCNWTSARRSLLCFPRAARVRERRAIAIEARISHATSALMRFEDVCLEAFGHVIPERVVRSSDIESRLAPIYERLNLSIGRLQLMSGIEERHFFEPGTR